MKIAVLMSTYNGEAYVKEQIESILLQVGLENLELYIRDDGSSDSTTDILKLYDTTHKSVFFINKGNIKNIGIQRSFLTLLEYAFTHSQADYYAFADQDDVWKNEKLIVGLQQINTLPDNLKGKLYYSNKTFVDEKLHVIKEEKIKYYNDIYEVLWRNLASGCTMIFDNRFVKICLRHRPEMNTLHDNWIYHVAKLIGSSIVFDKNSYILYRQHGNNNVGINGAKLYNDDSFFVLKNSIPFLFKKRDHIKQQIIKEIFENYKDLMPDENKELAHDVIHYTNSFTVKLRLIFTMYKVRKDWKDRANWTYKILSNRL